MLYLKSVCSGVLLSHCVPKVAFAHRHTQTRTKHIHIHTQNKHTCLSNANNLLWCTQGTEKAYRELLVELSQSQEKTEVAEKAATTLQERVRS